MLENFFIGYIVVAMVINIFVMFFAYKEISKYSNLKLFYFFFISPMVALSLIFKKK